MKLEQTLQAVMHYIHAGDLSAAEKLLGPLQASRRNHPDVMFLSGWLACRKSDYATAINLLRKVLRAEPLHLGARFVLGTALVESDQAGEAITHLTKYISSDPDNADAYYNLGNACRKCGRSQEAKDAYLKSIALNPANVPAYNNLAVMCREDGDMAGAIQYLTRAAAIAPSGDVFYNLLAILIAENSPEKFVRALDVLRLREPGIALPFAYSILQESCCWSSLNSIQDRMLEQAISGGYPAIAVQDVLMTLNCRPGLDPDVIFRLHQIWARIAHAGRESVGDSYRMPEADKLRIGYISGDFCNHSVGYFINNIIASHNRDLFEVHCYATYLRDDDISRKIMQSAHSFTNVAAMTDVERARRIHEDGVHILVDLAGHTAHSGINALIHRPAPVQVSYLGYPNTTGLDEVDFRITDRHADVPEGTRYTEELLYMPESFLCFGALTERPLRQNLPQSECGYVTFASFNNVRKLTPDVVKVWSGMLSRVPGSRLMIKSKQLGWDFVRANLIAAFAERGIPAERLILQGYIAEKGSHLDLYNSVDIALDTFPYNGTTTTCEALWMGVPVITLAGNQHVQRVSYSLLKNCGIEETIAWSEQEYIDIAVKLATDAALLQSLRARLPAAVRGSILCNPARFTRQLEELYCEAWRRKGFALPLE